MHVALDGHTAMRDPDPANSHDDLVLPAPRGDPPGVARTRTDPSEWTWPSDDEIPLVTPAPPSREPLGERLRRHGTLRNPYAYVPGAPRPRRRGRSGALAVFGAIVLLALGAGGYLLGHHGPADARSTATLGQEASRAGVGLRFPAEWTQVKEPTDIPGLRFEQPLALSTDGAQDAGIVAGIVPDAVGSDLLPAALRKRLSDPEPETVLLGGVQALRYARADVEDYAQKVTLFAIPTANGSVMIACHAAVFSDAFAALCDRSAATLRVQGQRVFAIGPDAGYGRRVDTAIGGLGTALNGDGARLAKARTPRGQASAADGVKAAFTRVARTLERGALSARDRDANTELVAAIRAEAKAYGRLASAARAGSRSRYATARDAARRSDRQVREGISALRVLGYET